MGLVMLTLAVSPHPAKLHNKELVQ
jgi:hypothetical protein